MNCFEGQHNIQFLENPLFPNFSEKLLWNNNHFLKITDFHVSSSSHILYAQRIKKEKYREKELAENIL